MITAWAAYINAHGGINGHPVDLIVKLEPGNLGVALADVKALVSDGVVAIIDHEQSDDASWVAYAEQQKIPIFVSTFPSIAMLNNPLAFSSGASEEIGGDEIVLGAKLSGATKIGILYCAEAPGCAQIVPEIKAAAQQIGGMDVVAATSVSSSAPNYTAQCLSLQSAGAQAIYIATANGTALSVAGSCAQQGYHPHIVALDAGFSDSFAKAPGTDGMIGATSNYPWFLTGAPGAQEMHDAVNAYAPGLLDDPNVEGTVIVDWTLGELIVEAAKAGGVGTSAPISKSALLAGVYKLHHTNVGGMAPTLTFTQGKAQPAQQQCWFWVEVQNGQWTVPAGGAKPVCAPSS
jgi:branched-chain amino acid transport system substrate-binding protein